MTTLATKFEAAAIHAMATMAEELAQPRLSEWLTTELEADRHHSLLLFCNDLARSGTIAAMHRAGIEVNDDEGARVMQNAIRNRTA